MQFSHVYGAHDKYILCIAAYNLHVRVRFWVKLIIVELKNPEYALDNCWATLTYASKLDIYGVWTTKGPKGAAV